MQELVEQWAKSGGRKQNMSVPRAGKKAGEQQKASAINAIKNGTFGSGGGGGYGTGSGGASGGGGSPPGGPPDLVDKWTKRMIEIVNEETGKIVARRFSGAFLQNKVSAGTAKIEASAANGEEWVIPISFDVRAVTRKSMANNKTIYMPLKVNSPELMAAKHAVRGIWHGEPALSTLRYPDASAAGFMQRIVDRFNEEAKVDGVRAELNEMYNAD